jgi:hypothetical protein
MCLHHSGRQLRWMWRTLLFLIFAFLCNSATNHDVLSPALNSGGGSGGGPRLLFAAAAAPIFHTNVQKNRIYPDAAREYRYNTDLAPSLVPWHTLRALLRQAGCFTTRALPRLTGSPDDDNLTRVPGSKQAIHAGSRITNRTDFAASLATLPPVCRKPVALFSGRSNDCESCNRFTEDMLRNYAAEWSYVRDHVTLVDTGDPMTDRLTRHPFPLWYDTAAMARELVLTPRFGVSAGDGDAQGPHASTANGTVTASDTSAQQLTDDEADYALFTAGLRQKAALLTKAPDAQAGHRWSHLIRRTFAFPSEYVLRIVFVYPHNGSIMRDVVNDDIFDGASPDYPHFFSSATPFLRAVQKAVRVMDWLERFGDY